MKKPIKILFDANSLATNDKSGIGIYTYNLVQSLASNYPEDTVLIGHYFNFLGRKKGFDLPSAPNIKYVRTTLIPGKFLNILRRISLQLPIEVLFKTRGEIIIFPNYGYLPSITKVLKITTIHDLGFVDYPEYVSAKNGKYLRRFVPKSIRSAQAIITVSGFSKSRIKSVFKTDKPILVTPIPPASAKLAIKGDLKIKGEYILFIGNIEPRKNIGNIIDAYMALDSQTRSKYSLVLAGSTGWYIENEINKIKSLIDNGEKIILTGRVSEEQKSWLYQNTSMLLFISHYEGFGMPILEAMQYKVPMLLSDIPVFHEVGEDAAFYCNKDDPEDIAAKIKVILDKDPSLNKKLSKYDAILKKYSWKQNATSVFDLINSLLRG